MCKICDNLEWLIDQDGIICGIGDGKITVSAEDYDTFEFYEVDKNINYCPVCGKCLTAEHCYSKNRELIKTFNAEKYIKDMSRITKITQWEKDFAKKYDGIEVKDNKIGYFHIHDEWCNMWEVIS